MGMEEHNNPAAGRPGRERWASARHESGCNGAAGRGAGGALSPDRRHGWLAAWAAGLCCSLSIVLGLAAGRREQRHPTRPGAARQDARAGGWRPSQRTLLGAKQAPPRPRPGGARRRRRRRWQMVHNHQLFGLDRNGGGGETGSSEHTAAKPPQPPTGTHPLGSIGRLLGRWPSNACVDRDNTQLSSSRSLKVDECM